ncbi:uncharacterized protein A1O5_10923 [Cladophialophora psammophila CBS 110553]|uniref:DUF2264 domain-containing protein n=1 Tax=Cladophialophora psammophila CBS 110553 TaxID=1182543 RepID=W9WCV9_9EURO|nr:uncharacterized protein A1O5_10923 [Cladophialophora psammophila CBS 110553]EXJ65947.1 hypothetical protein A1O5_10923 [Cladophialophora psammophila CBS 110553]
MAAGTSPSFFTSLNSALATRSEIVQACKSLLTPLLPFFSPGKTRLRLGATATRYDEAGAQLEGFTRPMWGLGALLAGGESFEGSELWLEGIRNGTNPDHPEFWGWSKDLDQRMVEMCPLGFALCVAPGHFWKPLNERERENVRRWLDINKKEMPNTNWLWFRVFANLALMKNGAEYDAERLEADLNHLDNFHLSGGWSNDGPPDTLQMDYYSGSFAIQYLQLLYAKLNGDRDPKRADIYRDRARMYAKDFLHYFDEQGQDAPVETEALYLTVSGRAMTFGRSLTYRFAMAGFWAAVAFADLHLEPPLSCGVIKGILLRNLRYWSQQKDTLNGAGILTIGYGYPNQFISENYNSPGSTYWFMLSFAALALPESHEFWQCREEPYPCHSIPQIVALKHPKHIMVRRGGHTFLLSSGQMCHYPMRAAESKYGKFAYSTAFGYSVPTGGYFVEAIGGDNILAVSDDQGESWKVRRMPLNARLETVDGTPVLISEWKPWADTKVETYLLPPTEATPNWHLRVHHIRTGSRNLKTSEGSFALNGVSEKDERELQQMDTDKSEGRLADNGEAVAVTRGGAVGIVELHQPGARAGRVLDEDANSNLMESRSVLPSLAMDIAANAGVWVATGVFAMPSSVSNYKRKWQKSWMQRPQIPDWLRNRMV